MTLSVLPDTQTVLETGTCHTVVSLMVTEQDHLISIMDHRQAENESPIIHMKISTDQ